MTESKSYALSLEALPALDFSHHLEDLIELRGFLEVRGIRTKNTRIERYISYLKQTIEQNSFNAESIFKNATGGPFNSCDNIGIFNLTVVLPSLLGVAVHPAKISAANKLELNSFIFNYSMPVKSVF